MHSIGAAAVDATAASAATDRRRVAAVEEGEAIYARPEGTERRRRCQRRNENLLGFGGSLAITTETRSLLPLSVIPSFATEVA